MSVVVGEGIDNYIFSDKFHTVWDNPTSFMFHIAMRFCLTNLNVLLYNAASAILTQNIKNKFIS